MTEEIPVRALRIDNKTGAITVVCADGKEIGPFDAESVTMDPPPGKPVTGFVELKVSGEVQE